MATVRGIAAVGGATGLVGWNGEDFDVRELFTREAGWGAARGDEAVRMHTNTNGEPWWFIGDYYLFVVFILSDY